MYDRTNRPDIAGPNTPAAPYPIFSSTQVFAGFGRGSSDLGIPTANLPEDSFNKILKAVAGVDHGMGIYFGYAKIAPSTLSEREILSRADIEVPCDRNVEYTYGRNLRPEDQQVLPMVMSVGLNPFYHNTKPSAEIHVIHKFANTFYGADIKYVVLGHIRPELDYISKEALIDDINFDIKVALASLKRPAYAKYEKDDFFREP